MESRWAYLYAALGPFSSDSHSKGQSEMLIYVSKIPFPFRRYDGNYCNRLHITAQSHQHKDFFFKTCLMFIAYKSQFVKDDWKFSSTCQQETTGLKILGASFFKNGVRLFHRGSSVLKCELTFKCEQRGELVIAEDKDLLPLSKWEHSASA